MLVEEYIEEAALNLERISYQIAELTRIKEVLEVKISEALQHEGDKQQSYVQGRFKITIKTGVNYTLDKEEYEVVSSRLPKEINPVTVVTKYEINKKVLREAYTYGSADEIAILDSFLRKKPAKLSVTIGAAV